MTTTTSPRQQLLSAEQGQSLRSHPSEPCPDLAGDFAQGQRLLSVTCVDPDDYARGLRRETLDATEGNDFARGQRRERKPADLQPDFARGQRRISLRGYQHD